MRKTVLVIALSAALSSWANPASSQNLFGMFSSKSTGQEADPAEITAQAQALADKQEDWMRPFVRALYRDGEWGSVLHLERLGLAAMEKQRFELARKAFDEAIVRVEAIYADDANAAKARSVFNGEKLKDFKGEPYERAMLYFYRGLLYAHEGDYQNARASFLAADRHDTLSSAEDKAFVGNFGLMKYLAGWASQCDGDATRAAQLIEESRAVDPKMLSLPVKPTNSVVLIDSGAAPIKWGDGEYKHVLKFKHGAGDDPAIVVKTADGTPISNLTLAGDVTYQATTRGGREIDGILAGKAQFKDTAGTVGNISLAAGSQVAMAGASYGNRNMANAGLAAMFIGLVAKGIEHASNPAADVRAWDSLPGRVMLSTEQDLAHRPIQFAVGGSARPVTLQATQGNCSLAWARTRSALTGDMGGTVRIEEEVPADANRGDRNRSFRAMLVNELVAAK